MRFIKTIIRLSMVPVLCLGLLAGCQLIGNAAGSQRIPAKHLLFIPAEGPLHITWEAKHLTISFKGRVSQDILSMEGRIDITGGGIQNFAMLEHLVVDIYLADSEGTVLKRFKFYSTDNSPIDDRIPRTFKRSFRLPGGTTHIAFGYDGKVRDGGSKILPQKGSAMEYGFQHSPFR